MQLDRSLTETNMHRRILRASTSDEWLAVQGEMTAAAFRWRECGVPSDQIFQAVNDWHDLLIGRILTLTVSDLAAAGFGAPPSRFAWLLLGSGGRREQTLYPDQDNALLYEETDGAQAYFSKLAEQAVKNLAAAGYPACQGFVMATNPRWIGSLEKWRAATAEYLAYPDWDHVRYLMIGADLRCAYGDRNLAGEFATWYVKQLQGHGFVHRQAAERGVQRQAAVDFLGRLRLDRWGEHEGELHVKEGGYLQLVSAVRLWTVAHGIAVTPTAERIQALELAGIWHPAWADHVQAALRVLTGHRLWGNYMQPDSLCAPDLQALKAALKTVKHVQKKTARRFSKPGL